MKYTTALSLVSITIFLSGCVTPALVDYEQSAVQEIASYKSFAIDTREKRSHYQDIVLSPIVDRRIERAIEQTLTSKGFEKLSSKPDFRVTFNTVTKTKTELNDFGPAPFRRKSFYGYNGRYIDFEQYEEGTFIIDIIDGKSNELVWRGSYVKRLGWSAPDEAEIQRIIDSILATFPPGTTPKAY